RTSARTRATRRRRRRAATAAAPFRERRSPRPSRRSASVGHRGHHASSYHARSVLLACRPVRSTSCSWSRWSAPGSTSWGRALAQPIVVWLLFGTTLVGFYASPLFPLSLDHPWLHALVHLHFVLVGCVFLWPLIGVDAVPRPLPFAARLLAVLVAVPFHAFL